MATPLSLTSVFEFIADAGYIAYNEDFDHLQATASGTVQNRENRLMRYKWQEKKITSKYQILKNNMVYKYVFPRLSAKD